MNASVTPAELEKMLCDGGEIAVVDVREHGAYGERHLFFCTSIPYSRLEFELPRLVPNLGARVVIYDAHGGPVSRRAEMIAAELGYRDVARLDGGMRAWVDAGYGTFAGVHVPSKTLGELVEHAYETPSMSAEELAARQQRGDPVVILDGRSWEEHQAMSIPGGASCPNGELAYRVGELAPDVSVPVVIHCAGRTRSIIGCETLRQFGVTNPVYALRNGTMGWRLAGMELEHGSQRRAAALEPVTDVAERRERALQLAARAGVTRESAETVRAWLGDASRTTFLLDVRDPREYELGHIEGAVSAPGGQLVQATDTFVGVQRARLVLVDDTEVRAAVCGFWLAQMGYDVAILAGGAAAWSTVQATADTARSVTGAGAPISVASLAAEMAATQPPLLLDCRASMAFRAAHIPQAQWVIRPQLDRVIVGRESSAPVRIVADDARVAALMAKDLGRLGFSDVAVLDGGFDAWRAADQPEVATPDMPADDSCIDYLFFVHDRHAGNMAAARQYIAWEQGLVEALSPSEREHFKLVVPQVEDVT